MTHVRIIGVGSPAGDDQAGWQVVRRLQGSGVLEHTGCDTSAVVLDRPGVGVIEHLQGADIVILIDATKSGRAPPGTIHRMDETELVRNESDALSSHAFGLASALALARTLGALPPKVVVYGIEVDHLAFDAAPCGAVSEAVARLTRTIATELP